ncbi:MAG: hypothetical protein AAFR61_10470 [Bacteroidota bacterium]
MVFRSLLLLLLFAAGATVLFYIFWDWQKNRQVRERFVAWLYRLEDRYHELLNKQRIAADLAGKEAEAEWSHLEKDLLQALRPELEHLVSLLNAEVPVGIRFSAKHPLPALRTAIEEVMATTPGSEPAITPEKRARLEEVFELTVKGKLADEKLDMKAGVSW